VIGESGSGSMDRVLGREEESAADAERDAWCVRLDRSLAKERLAGLGDTVTQAVS
jgi:hypothetical protein